VVVSPQAGLRWCALCRRNLREVATFLSASQVNLQRQVVLEAKIIEVTCPTVSSLASTGRRSANRRGKTALFTQTGAAGSSTTARRTTPAIQLVKMILKSSVPLPSAACSPPCST